MLDPSCRAMDYVALKARQTLMMIMMIMMTTFLYGHSATLYDNDDDYDAIKLFSKYMTGTHNNVRVFHKVTHHCYVQEEPVRRMKKMKEAKIL